MRVALALALSWLVVATIPGEAKDKKQTGTETASVAQSEGHRSCGAIESACVPACSGKKDCIAECASDCEVCALDFGEEPASVCKK